MQMIGRTQFAATSTPPIKKYMNQSYWEGSGSLLMLKMYHLCLFPIPRPPPQGSPSHYRHRRRPLSTVIYHLLWFSLPINNHTKLQFSDLYWNYLLQTPICRSGSETSLNPNSQICVGGEGKERWWGCGRTEAQRVSHSSYCAWSSWALCMLSSSFSLLLRAIGEPSEALTPFGCFSRLGFDHLRAVFWRRWGVVGPNNIASRNQV